MDAIIQSLPQLVKGLGYTLEYSLLGIVCALVIAMLGSYFKLSRFRVLRLLGSIYVELFRDTPLLVQIMFIYFGLPVVVSGLRPFFGSNYTIIAATIALALHEGAYITEIIRAGILSIDKGQKEAAQSIGMTPVKTMIYIILPQAFKRMIPPLVNQFAIAIKDTSLLSAIGITELIYTGQIIIAGNFKAFQIWGAIFVLYFIVIFFMAQIARYLERRLQIDHR